MCVEGCLASLSRALTPEMLTWCASSGRFLFHKDTSVNTDIMLQKLAAVQRLPGNNMKYVSLVRLSRVTSRNLYRFFTAKIQFLSTILEHGGK